MILKTWYTINAETGLITSFEGVPIYILYFILMTWTSALLSLLTTKLTSLCSYWQLLDIKVLQGLHRQILADVFGWLCVGVVSFLLAVRWCWSDPSWMGQFCLIQCVGIGGQRSELDSKDWRSLHKFVWKNYQYIKSVVTLEVPDIAKHKKRSA